MTRGDRVIGFIEHHCLVPEGKLVGQPMKLAEFQKRFIRSIYDNPAGTRRAYLGIARKNGKTGLIAALVLAHLVGPEAKLNSQIVSGARSRDQAALVFNLASKMVSLSANDPRPGKKLHQFVRVVPSGKRLIGISMNTEYRALAADGTTAHGLSPILAILDEVGQVKGPQDDFIDAITTSQGAHESPLLICISTQAPTDADLFSIWLDDAEKSKDPRIVSHLYAAPADCDLEDENAWAAANPALGTFRSIDDVREQAKQAARLPSAEASFRNLILNQRIQTEAPFLTPRVWDANSGSIDEAIFFDGRPVFAGLDLSARTDLTAMVLAARDDEGRVHLWPHVWTPEATLLDRAARDRAPYDAWVREGYLRTTPGSAIDYDWIASDIGSIISGMWISAGYFDRWRIDVMVAAFERQGVSLPLEPMGQGYKDMSPAIDAFEAAALEAALRHGNHPVLRWCVSNAVVDMDPAGNRKLTKNKSFGRIDAAIAAIMGARGLLCETELDGMTGRGELLLI